MKLGIRDRLGALDGKLHQSSNYSWKSGENDEKRTNLLSDNAPTLRRKG
jgi:hypothetical protein